MGAEENVRALSSSGSITLSAAARGSDEVRPPARCAGVEPKTGFLPTGRSPGLFWSNQKNHFKITETNDPVM